jgi:hypothetical protein
LARGFLVRLCEHIQKLEGELARSRRDVLLCTKKIFARQPLPYGEEELCQIVAHESGVSLETLLEGLDQVGPGQQSA